MNRQQTSNQVTNLLWLGLQCWFWLQPETLGLGFPTSSLLKSRCLASNFVSATGHCKTGAHTAPPHPVGQGLKWAKWITNGPPNRWQVQHTLSWMGCAMDTFGAGHRKPGVGQLPIGPCSLPCRAALWPHFGCTVSRTQKGAYLGPDGQNCDCEALFSREPPLEAPTPGGSAPSD